MTKRPIIVFSVAFRTLDGVHARTFMEAHLAIVRRLLLISTEVVS